MLLALDIPCLAQPKASASASNDIKIEIDAEVY
jgi:hypothetical protein